LIQEHFLTSYFQDAFLDYFYIKRLIHFYSLPVTRYPLQPTSSANDRQNFFETPSTRTRTSSSEGVTGGWWRVAGEDMGKSEEVTGSEWLVADPEAPSAL
jgi:hypothetical protein